MDDAYDFWQQKKYKEASYLWEYVYEEQKNETTRAMAAANLAVYNELFDNYKVAIEWVDWKALYFLASLSPNKGDVFESEVFVCINPLALRALPLYFAAQNTGGRG